MLIIFTGAGSADFRRFIDKFYDSSHGSKKHQGADSRLSSGGPGHKFLGKVWEWVTKHSDIRITHNNQHCLYSLSDFEAAELQDATPTRVVSATGQHDHASSVTPTIAPASSLLGLRDALRQRLSSEGHDLKTSTMIRKASSFLATGVQHEAGRASIISQGIAVSRLPRKMPVSSDVEGSIFDEPSSTTAGPRLHASQNRVWQALTGHSIDLKKVPNMEFILLSIIAAHGPEGVTQPELVRISNQDKRSVPHRTAELARKGYIAKSSVQAKGARTSLCVHTKFVSPNHFLTSSAVDDVFQKGTFVTSGFVQLLYNKLKDAGIVPTREIRTRLVSGLHDSNGYR
jgi:hypothetical protein